MRRLSLILAPLAFSCSQSAAPRDAAPADATLALFRAHGAEVSAFLATADAAPRASAGGFSWVTRTGTLVAEAPARADGALRLTVPEANVAIRALGPTGAAHVEERHLVYGGRADATVLFARPDAIEALVRVRERASLAYVIEHAPGTALRRIEDGQGGTIELVAQGRPVLRMTADRAWDANGRAIPVTLALSGDRVDVRLPGDAIYPVAIDPTWSSTRTPVRLRRQHTATTLGDGRVLFTGGFGTSTAEIFDPTTGRFASTGSMSEARYDHFATLLADGRVLVAGGRAAGGGASSSTAEIFDPRAGTFTKAGAMTVGRASAGGVRLPSGKVFVSGGAASAEIFDAATGTFAAAAGKKTSAAGAPAMLANGDVLVIGEPSSETYRPSTGAFTSFAAPKGADGDALLDEFTTVALRDGRALVFGVRSAATAGGPVFYTTDAYVFTPPSTFATTAKMGIPSAGHAVLLPSGKVLHVGDSGAELWNPSAGTWAAAPGIAAGHQAATFTVLPSGDVLVVGGWSAASVDLYRAQDPAGPGTWSKTGLLARDRADARASLLLDGRVIVTGGSGVGSGAADPAATAEIFSASTGKFGSVIPLTKARGSHAQVVLPSGKLLIVGSDASAELLDPSTGASASTGSMSAARSQPGVAVLPDGKVLVAGGGPSTAEIYDPGTGTFGAPIAMTAARHETAAILLGTGKVLVLDRASVDLFDPRTGTFTATASPVGSDREPDTARLLASGEVLLGGGSVAAFDRYDPAAGTWSLSSLASTAPRSRKGVTLPGGHVLVTGGIVGVYGVQTATAHFSPIAAGNLGDLVDSGALPLPVERHTATWLPSGGALLAGGNPCVLCVPSPGIDTAVYKDRAQTAWRPTIAAAPSKVAAGESFAITGARLTGVAGGESASNARSPVATWIPASTQGQVVATVTAFDDTSATITVPATALAGKGWLVMAVDGVVGPAVALELEPAKTATACSVGADCATGFCVDGVCCDSACDGACQACTKARKGSGDDGTCGAIPAGKDPKDACALFQGAPCTDGAECATGICVDGVCCDAACDGQCEACDVEGSKGVCVPVVGAPHGGRAACDVGDGACASRLCDGKARGSCAGFTASTAPCRAASCVDGVETLAATCDGAGACPAVSTRKCEPFACGDTTCLTKCSVDAECAPSYRCAEGKCVTGAYCDGDHTVKIPGGSDKDCTPFRCEGERCKEACGSSDDCVGGYLCQSGACVAASTAATDESGGGCGCRVMPDRPGSRAVSLALAACLGLGLRRRRARQER